MLRSLRYYLDSSSEDHRTVETENNFLYITDDMPVRIGYSFLGWSTKTATETPEYVANDKIIFSGNTTLIKLYAVWKYHYTKPSIRNVKFNRCNSDGALNDNGTYIKVECTWSTYYNATSIKCGYITAGFNWRDVDIPFTSDTKSGTIAFVYGDSAISVDKVYSTRIIVSDQEGSTTISGTIPSVKYPIDFYKNGVGIGKAAVGDNRLDIAYPTRHDDDVYIKDNMVLAKRCVVSQGTGTDKPWYKFAEADISKIGQRDISITFLVTKGLASKFSYGFLSAHIRTNADYESVNSADLVITGDSDGMNIDNFALAYNGKNVELWVKITATYTSYLFEELFESTRTNFANNIWSLINISSNGYETNITSGYTIIQARRSMRNILNTVASINDDTPAFWAKQGNSTHYFNASNLVHGQPNQYGLLINYVIDNSIKQYWVTGIHTYIRSGTINTNEWDVNGTQIDPYAWVEIADSKNVVEMVKYDYLALTGGNVTGTTHLQNGTNTAGTFRFNNEWFGMYASGANARSNTDRKGWLGFNGTTNFTINNGAGGNNVVNKAWTVSSDRRLKKDISEIGEDFYKIWMELTPKMYRWSSPNSDKDIHFGLIAQEVIAIFEKYGYDVHDYGIVNEYEDEDGARYFGVTYEEYQMLSSYVLGILATKVEKLERRIQNG